MPAGDNHPSRSAATRDDIELFKHIEANLYTAVVADSLDGLKLTSFRHGVGVSPLLIRLPIGDVSLAWGFPLDPGPGDTRIGVFHVNVGLLF